MEYESSTKASNTAEQYGLDLLASTLAHEIRNPLQVMRLQVESALRGASSQDVITQISKSLDRLERVVNKVQSLSQKHSLQFSSSNIQEVIERAISSSRVWLQAAGIEVQVSTRWEGKALCQIDPDLFEQVILNLVTNAIHAMPQGGALRIDISECSDSAEIKVQDTGRGMSAEVLQSFGTPFFTTKPEGNGLGTSFCKTIIAMHGGSFQVESIEAQGTCITLRIPKVQRGN